MNHNVNLESSTTKDTEGYDADAESMAIDAVTSYKSTMREENPQQGSSTEGATMNVSQPPARQPVFLTTHTVNLYLELSLKEINLNVGHRRHVALVKVENGTAIANEPNFTKKQKAELGAVLIDAGNKRIENLRDALIVIPYVDQDINTLEVLFINIYPNRKAFIGIAAELENDVMAKKVTERVTAILRTCTKHMYKDDNDNPQRMEIYTTKKNHLQPNADGTGCMVLQFTRACLIRTFMVGHRKYISNDAFKHLISNMSSKNRIPLSHEEDTLLRQTWREDPLKHAEWMSSEAGEWEKYDW